MDHCFSCITCNFCWGRISTPSDMWLGFLLTLIELSSGGQSHVASASFPPWLIPCCYGDGYHARLRPKGDISPDQAAVLILSAQITAPSPPRRTTGWQTGRTVNQSWDRVRRIETRRSGRLVVSYNIHLSDTLLLMCPTICQSAFLFSPSVARSGLILASRHCQEKTKTDRLTLPVLIFSFRGGFAKFWLRAIPHFSRRLKM